MPRPVRIFVCVEGLFEKSDSIGFDAVYQWKLLRDQFDNSLEVRLFCDTADPGLYRDVEIESFPEFLRAIQAVPDAVVVYHFCDGWPALEDTLIDHANTLIVRWHNNTPPWFLTKYALRFAERTIRGYSSILRLAQNTKCQFWCNSGFTARQLEVLGVHRGRIHVVYPASRYLDCPKSATWIGSRPEEGRATILFVGRIVPHKGHRHDLVTAAYLRHRLGLPTEVILPGRADPGILAYSNELKNLAEKLSVDLSLPGEVDTDQLDYLYRRATVFLCLSQHEGFGLPIFEAMRMGLPAAVCEISATAELVAGHPLAHHELSPRWFAAAIATLQEAKIVSYVRRWQDENILPKYTRESVTAQIVNGLARCGIPKSDGNGLDTVQQRLQYSDSDLEEIIKMRIKAYLKQIGEKPIDGEQAIPREISGNFVTLYDLEAYETLCSTQLTLLSPRNAEHYTNNTLLVGQQSPGVFLAATRFTSHSGMLVNGNYVCPLRADPSHLIYGPYCRLGKGSYRVEYHIEVLELPDRGPAEFIFDIAINASWSLCESIVSLEEFRAGEPIALEFFLPQQSEAIEFRIAARSFLSGTLRFEGVTLAPIASLMELLEATPPYRPRGNALDAVIKRNPQKSVGTRRRLLMMIAGHRSGAGAMFAAADQARSQRDWETAITLYARGLKLDSQDVVMWIRYANVLKECGRFKEAESALHNALRLDPENPDANLHMGHVLKLQGRLIDAVTYYARTSVLAPAAGHFARQELVKLGLFEDVL